MRQDRFYIEEEGIIFTAYSIGPTPVREEKEHHGMCYDIALDEPYESDICFRVGDESPKENPVNVPTPPKVQTSPPPPPRYVTVDILRLQEAGVPEYLINMILENDVELSTIRITPSGRIVLPEYRIEIKMTPLDKALYFLYLKHPEGIRFKELCDYKEELMTLYSSVTGRDDLEKIQSSVDALVDPSNNSINEKRSHIKSAFTKAFSPELAKHYYIDGKSGEAMSISLDRNKVIWEKS